MTKEKLKEWISGLRFTARITKQRSLIRIHLKGCGVIPSDIGECRDVIELDDGVVLFTTNIGTAMSYWFDPVPVNKLSKTLASAMRYIHGELMGNPEPCAMCRSFEIIRFKRPEKGKWNLAYTRNIEKKFKE